MPEHIRRPDPDPPSDDCRQVIGELQTFLDAECSADMERSIRVHLRHCRPCLGRADFEVELKALVASRCWQQAPAGLVDKVLTSLRHISRTSGTERGSADVWGDV